MSAQLQDEELRKARIDGQLIAIKLINELAGLDKATFDNALYIYMRDTMKEWQDAYNLPATEIDRHLAQLTHQKDKL